MEGLIMLDNDVKSLDEIQAVKRVDKDIRKAVKELGNGQARYLVDAFYREQGERIAADNMIRAAKEVGEPTEVIEFIAEQHRINEKSIKSMLNTYTSQSELGKWCKSICGIGEVITAGLMAHIDIEKAQTAGAIWRFAGLDPTLVWGKGQKRPFNAKLKRLCFIIGQSFIKVQNRENDVYGHIFAERKAFEQQMNEDGMYAEQAREKLEKFNIGKNTEAYKWYSKGMLPPAHINMRAARYAVKIFLSHYFEVAYELEYDKRAPEIYAIAILQHAHKIDVPNWTHKPVKP
jgi:KaiC/GvpD/RAD55 family RecA-like ATPase